MSFYETCLNFLSRVCNIGHLWLWFFIPADINSLWSERTTSKVTSSLHCNPRENYFSREQMVLTATKTNWRETFNQEHKEKCWSSFKPLKSFNIDSNAEWKSRIWLTYWWKWNGWERGFLWNAKHKIIDFLNSINSKSKEAGGGGRAHSYYTNSACFVMENILVRKMENTPVRSGGWLSA